MAIHSGWIHMVLSRQTETALLKISLFQIMLMLCLLVQLKLEQTTQSLLPTVASGLSYK